jgi:hypothetical protein
LFEGKLVSHVVEPIHLSNLVTYLPTLPKFRWRGIGGGREVDVEVEVEVDVKVERWI